MYKPCECGSVLYVTDITSGREIVEIDEGCPDVLMLVSCDVDETTGDYDCYHCGKPLEEVDDDVQNLRRAPV